MEELGYEHEEQDFNSSRKIWKRVLAKKCPGIGRILVSKDRQCEMLAGRQVRARSTEQQRGGDHMSIHL